MALPSNFSIEQYLSALAQRTGASVEPSDITKFYEKHPEDQEQFVADLTAQYERRGDSQTTGSGPDSSTVLPPSVTNPLPRVMPIDPGTLGNVVTMGPVAAPNVLAGAGGPTGLMTRPFPASYPATSGFGGMSMSTMLILAVVAFAAYYLVVRH